MIQLAPRQLRKPVLPHTVAAAPTVVDHREIVAACLPQSVLAFHILRERDFSSLCVGGSIHVLLRRSNPTMPIHLK